MKVGTHCQTTALIFGPVCTSVFFDRPLFLRVTDDRPLKSNIFNTKLPTKVIQMIFKAFHTLNTIYFTKLGENKHLLQVILFQFEVDHPSFWPSKELTAPRFWRSLPPLCMSIWQWVTIQYLSAPPPPGKKSLTKASSPLS